VEDVRKLVADRPEKRLENIEKGVGVSRHNDGEVMQDFNVRVSRECFQVCVLTVGPSCNASLLSRYG